ncbi:unnamed protein product, partial [marine sediment metagenome]
QAKLLVDTMVIFILVESQTGFSDNRYRFFR